MPLDAPIPPTVRLHFSQALAAKTAVQRRHAATLLRRYPGLALNAEVGDLLVYYPVVGPPIPDPRLPCEQVARQFIDAALEQRKWSGIQRVHHEVSFHSTRTQQTFIADYMLSVFVARLNKYVPVAFIEAKSRCCVPADGLQQAKNYADVYPNNVYLRFVFSTNGIHFIRYDRWIQRTQKAKPLESFPTPYVLAKSIDS